MSQILVVGSLAYDSIKTPVGSVEKTLGGSANYFSVAASILSPVRVVGVVGDDYAAQDKKVLENYSQWRKD
jgi:sugar/nucleoside kinase (ribokinase family)